MSDDFVSISGQMPHSAINNFMKRYVVAIPQPGDSENFNELNRISSAKFTFRLDSCMTGLHIRGRASQPSPRWRSTAIVVRNECVASMGVNE